MLADTPKIDIRPDHWQVVHGILQKHVPQYAVWVFGSRAKWTAKDHSDLDLCIKTNQPLDFRTLAKLQEDFSESDLPWKVDIVDWSTTSESFRKIIERDKVVVQRAGRGLGVAGEWRISQIGDLTNNFDGKRKPVKEADRRPGPYPYYGASGIVDSVDDYLFDGNYLLVAEDGENLRTRQTPIAFMAIGKFWVNNHAHIITGNEQADTRFLMYALQGADINGYITGAVMPKLTQGNLNTIEIIHPPIEEQRAIAHILGALDDKIELNRRMNQTLEAMARALFKSWFVDFDGIAPEDMQESELGLIPKGWRVASFGDLLESSIGGDWGKEQPEGDEDQPICIIRGTDFPDLRNGGKGGVPTRYTSKRKLASRVLQTGDIVIEVSGGSPTQPTGRSLRITQSILARFDSSVVCASFCRRFRPKNLHLGALASCHLDYLYQAGGTWEYQNQSTGISNFQTTHFLEAEKVVVPSDEQLEKFFNLVVPIFDSISTNQSLTLAQLRDTLLPKLISGELRIDKVDAI